MKLPFPMTDADCAIWLRLGRHWSGSMFSRIEMRKFYRRADRSDAMLIRHAEESRGYWLTPAEAWLCQWGCTNALCDECGCVLWVHQGIAG
jgi:hypothetical protein